LTANYVDRIYENVVTVLDNAALMHVPQNWSKKTINCGGTNS